MNATKNKNSKLFAKKIRVLFSNDPVEFVDIISQGSLAVDRITYCYGLSKTTDHFIDVGDINFL